MNSHAHNATVDAVIEALGLGGTPNQPIREEGEKHPIEEAIDAWLVGRPTIAYGAAADLVALVRPIIRAELVADIVAWLRGPMDEFDLAALVEREFGEPL